MYALLDAKERNKKYPDTFHIPSNDDLSYLRSGDYAKLCFEEEGNAPERMWVKVMSVSGDNFQGMLDNEPIGLETIKYGDIVLFNSRHILDTM